MRARLWCRRNPQLTITGVVALVLAALTAITYASVARLRAQRSALAAEMIQQSKEEDAIRARAAHTRAEVASTKAQLTNASQELHHLETRLTDEKQTYAALLAAKDKALLDANAATRDLIEQLSATRNDRRTIDAERALYRQFRETARGDAERAAKQRDQAQSDRDAARAERDVLKQERSAITAERDRARADRDLDDHRLAELTAALAAAEAKLESNAAVTRSGGAGDGSAAQPGGARAMLDAPVDAGVPARAVKPGPLRTGGAAQAPRAPAAAPAPPTTATTHTNPPITGGAAN